MERNLKMEIEKFNGKSFEMWKIKMEYFWWIEISGSW
jgi:hypothetical protein